MWKYISALVAVVVVILAIGFVRDKFDKRFINPLHTELQLAANFGEVRPDHFHMGVDIRTNGKENLPVYVIDDGYVSRVEISPYGYGKVIFVTHANGITSVYAHLNTFFDSLEAYVQRQQYAAQSWQQEIDFSAGAFTVKKGGLIAFSGNTGQSQGPHLHFELRDSRTGKNLNPALYGYGVDDNTPPSIKGLYWYDRRYSTYENGPTAIAVDENRVKRKIVKVSSPVISFGIRAEDRVDESRFKYGIYSAQVWLDGELVHEFVLDNFSGEESRYVNACIDYAYRMSSGLSVQHLSKLPGNLLPVFKGGDGVILLKDTLVHKVLIRVKDVAGNESELKFRLQRGNFDAVERKSPGEVMLLSPGRANRVSGGNVEIQFDKNSFYDEVPFLLKERKSVEALAASSMVSLHKSSVPVHNRFAVKLKTFLKPGDRLRQKTVMQFSGFKNKSVVKGSWEGDWYRGMLDELGTVQLVVDTVAPVVEFVVSEGLIEVVVKDNLGAVANFRGEIDGRWVPFTQKGNVFRYDFDKRTPPGRHRLVITASDVAGNTAVRRYEFTR